MFVLPFTVNKDVYRHLEYSFEAQPVPVSEARARCGRRCADVISRSSSVAGQEASQLVEHDDRASFKVRDYDVTVHRTHRNVLRTLQRHRNITQSINQSIKNFLRWPK